MCKKSAKAPFYSHLGPRLHASVGAVESWRDLMSAAGILARRSLVPARP